MRVQPVVNEAICGQRPSANADDIEQERNCTDTNRAPHPITMWRQETEHRASPAGEWSRKSGESPHTKIDDRKPSADSNKQAGNQTASENDFEEPNAGAYRGKGLTACRATIAGSEKLGDSAQG